jgi:hypothetical protein
MTGFMDWLLYVAANEPAHLYLACLEQAGRLLGAGDANIDGCTRPPVH